jgi:hypothetical protein
MRLQVLFSFLLLLASFSVSASTYYVSASGNDQFAGTSVATAWRTIERVNGTRLAPGDLVLFEGGSSFAGSISLRNYNQATGLQPIVFGSYGAGRAYINSGSSYGFYAHNVGGIELRRLNFVGSGRLSNTNSGIIFFLDSANVHLQHIVLDSVTVQGYRATGISIGSWNGTSGYDGVRITNCITSANGEAGLASYAQDLAAHHNWYVAYCKAFDNAGRADITTTHTGNGIVLSGIDSALVEHCEAYNNGWLNANPSGGPVGIWGWCCNNLTIQKCESHHNRSGTNHDGGGFDLDGGCTNSVLQYNYSHDNDGPGYLLAQYPSAPPLTDVTIRYNISENDGRRRNQGAIMLWSSGSNGGIQRAAIYNNTIYITPPADGSRPKAVDITSGGISDITFRNNLLQTTGSLPIIAAATTQGVTFQGNAYWSTGQPLTIQWGGAQYSSLSDWRTNSGQEMLSTQATGVCADPQLQSPGSGGTLGLLSSGRSLSTLVAYQLQPASGLMSAGLDLLATFGVNAGTRDFFGSSMGNAAGRNIGASENRILLGTNSAKSDTWCTSYPNPVRDVLYLSLARANTREDVLIQLYDVTGRVQFTTSRQAQSALGSELRIPLTKLAAGRYQLLIQQGNRRYGQAVVVE